MRGGSQIGDEGDEIVGLNILWSGWMVINDEPLYIILTMAGFEMFAPPEGKKMIDCPDDKHMMLDLKQYYLKGGFNKHVMSEKEYIPKNSVWIENMSNITLEQNGTQFNIVITLKSEEEEEEDEEEQVICV